MSDAAGAEDPSVKAQRDEDAATRAADFKADIDSLQTMQTNLYQLATGALERRRYAAETVQKSSAAIGTIYTGVLAFVYSSSAATMPLRGLIAPIFLGAAVVLSTAYLAYVLPPPSKPLTLRADVAGRVPKSFERLNTFIRYASEIAQRHAWMMRASVVALGVGVIAIALPFLTVAGQFSAGSPTSASPLASGLVPWPTPDLTMPEKYQLILYQAQINEAEKSRSRAAMKDPTDTLESFLIPLAAGATMVGLGAWLPTARRGRTSAAEGISSQLKDRRNPYLATQPQPEPGALRGLTNSKRARGEAMAANSGIPSPPEQLLDPCALVTYPWMGLTHKSEHC